MKYAVYTFRIWVFLIIFTPLHAQSIQTETIFFKGFEEYYLCDEKLSPTGDYDCVTREGFRENEYNFFDPVPAGSVVTKAEVTVFNQVGDESSIHVFINDELIGDIGNNGTDFRTGQECGINTTVSKEYPVSRGMPGYRYRDYNDFRIILRSHDKDQEMCSSHAEIKLTYDSSRTPFIQYLTAGSVVLLTIFLVIVLLRLRKKKKPRRSN